MELNSNENIKADEKKKQSVKPTTQIQEINIITTERKPISMSYSSQLCMIAIAYFIYRMRKDDYSTGILLCILCCPHLYITYVIVDSFIKNI